MQCGLMQRRQFSSRAYMEAATTKARRNFENARLETNIIGTEEAVPAFGNSPVKGR